MSASYKRQMLSDSIGFNSVIDPKFKTDTINVRFILPISKEQSAGYALAASLLTTSCRKYPSIASMSRKMNRMYGGSASVDVSKLGDFQIITASFSALCNRFAIDNEDIFGELIDIVNCCLFDPNVTEKGFSENEFAIKSKDLLDTIEAEINNKRSYAVRKCMNTAYKDEPCANLVYGTRESVLKLTPQSTFEAYKKMLRSAAVEIFFVSSEEQPTLADKFKEMFAKTDRKNAAVLPNFITPSPLKAETAEVSETLPVAQCKMVMAFKTDCKDVQTMLLMNMLYGATPFSKLFTNVREKLSLCYYCSSTYSETKQTMIVDCGVLKENIQTAKSEIINQLEAIAKGDFSDELLDNSRMSAYNSIKTLGDTPSSYVRWYFTDLIRGVSRNVEEAVAAYKAVTREQIMAAASSLKLDTVYILEASCEEVQPNE